MKIAYRLRPATLEDKKFMMYLERVHLEPYPKIMELFDEVYQRHYYEKSFRPRHVSIIEHDHKPIGALSVVVRRKGIFIVYIYTLPEYQDKGIDVSLIKKVLKQAKKEHKPIITCMLKEETQVKQIFEDFGFEVFMESDLRWRVRWTPPL